MEDTTLYLLNIEAMLILIFAFGMVFYFIEKINPAEKNTPFFKKDFIPELLLSLSNMAIFQPAFTLLMAFLSLYLFSLFLPYQAFDKNIQSLPFFVQLIAAMILADFSVYWRHRFTHYAMWSYHSVHHSAEQLTWLTKLRLHPGDIFAAAFFDTLILHVFGFNGAAILPAMMIMMAYDFFAHANLNLKYPKPLRYILASPHSHRWHHANVRDAYDKNFCSMFSFYDVLFGTFYHPEDLPPVYGLSKNEQKDFPAAKFLGWLVYPFRREYKRLFRSSKK